MHKRYLGLLAVVSAGVALASSTVVLPTGAGSFNTWKPSTGTTHYTLVDETTCNGTTDYVSTTVAGNRDSYSVSLASVPDGAIIRGVTVSPCASKLKSSGSATLGVFYSLNGVNSADGTFYLTGTTPTEIGGYTYSGLNVTKSSSTTLESGVVLTTGAAGARVSRLATTVSYINSAPATPASFSTTASSSSAISSWFVDDAPSYDGFVLEKSTDGVNFSVLATTTAATRTYVDGGLTSGTYYYKIRGFNPFGYSGYPTTTVVVLP
jgi:hypothetical protein